MRTFCRSCRHHGRGCIVVELPDKSTTFSATKTRQRELCVRLSVLRLFHVGHVMHFRLLSARMVFYVVVKKKKSTAESSRCRRNLKYENFTSSFSRQRQNLHQKVCRTCSTISFPHLTNQIDHWFVHGADVVVPVSKRLDHHARQSLGNDKRQPLQNIDYAIV